MVTIILIVQVCYGHSGRTDSNGGHRDNKNSSGLGSYHYHCGGHPAHLHDNGVCPYSSNYNSNVNTNTNININNNNNNNNNNNTSTSNDNSNAVKPDIEVEEVKISNKTTIKEIKLDSDYKISTSIEPYNATNKELKYESSNPSVVSISSDGEVKAWKSGKSTITVTSNNGKEDKIDINVIVDPKEIKITNTITNMSLDGWVEMRATVLPEGASYKIEWSSSDENVLKVDNNGKVTAIGCGTATITAKVNNTISDSVTISVRGEMDYLDTYLTNCLTTYMGISFFVGIIGVTYYIIKRKKLQSVAKNSNMDNKKEG